MTVAGVFGPTSVRAHAGVALDAAPDRLTLSAERDLAGLATGDFAVPTAGVRWEPRDWPSDIEFVGFAFTQFALPVVAGRDLDFDFAPAPGLRSPAALLPLIARCGDRVTLLAPLDHFHEQIVAVVDGGLVWGWHGDLDEVPAGLSTSLGIYDGGSVADVLDRWRRDLETADAIHPRRVSDNVLSTHLSYWTDNGAAYWYRTESERTISESVADKIEELRADEVPVRSVELDSWFYSHSVPRAITEVGYPDEVPPSGMSAWLPRPDAYPGRSVGGVEMGTSGEPDGVEAFADRLGRPPLVLHSRHIAPDSAYVDESWWVGRHAAHPSDPDFFRRWFDDAVRWGATVIEQDWMLISWFGVRELRRVPGRAAAWQRALNEHATDTGVDLVWCMATPADLLLSASLDRVIAVRTCDDYRFAPDPAMLWAWFLTVNRFVNVLDVPAFKDCFFSGPPGDDAIDGDAHAELEALLSALSGGPVGIGDRFGRTDRDVVMRTCDDDGRLRRVDRALEAADACLFGGPNRGDGLLWATTSATRSNAVWTYVVAINMSAERVHIQDTFVLDAPSAVLDWRSGGVEVATELNVALSPRDFAFFVVAPSVEPTAFDECDRSKYVVVEAD
ncbi:MAG: hypothetical protein AB8G14_14375 [Ilumatobacter sp.]